VSFVLLLDFFIAVSDCLLEAWKAMDAVFVPVRVAHKAEVEKAQALARGSLQLAVAHPAEARPT
jgi:hypothetical protein